MIRNSQNDKIFIFADEGKIISCCVGRNRLIGRVHHCNFKDMDGFMPFLPQPTTKCWRQLGVDQKLHQAAMTTG